MKGAGPRSAPFIVPVRLLCHGRQSEDLPEVTQIALVLAHALLGRVGDLGDGLPIGLDHLHDDVERLRPPVVHQVRADAEGDLDPAVEALVELYLAFGTVRLSLKMRDFVLGSQRLAFQCTIMRSPQTKGSPESCLTPSKSLQKNMSKSRRKGSIP